MDCDNPARRYPWREMVASWAYRNLHPSPWLPRNMYRRRHTLEAVAAGTAQDGRNAREIHTYSAIAEIVAQ